MTILKRLRWRMLRHLRYSESRTLARSIARLRNSPASPPSSSLLWTDAIYGWRNEFWSADDEYLAEVFEAALSTEGDSVECGTGLTTILLAIAAERTGHHVHSLEHAPEWKGKIESCLRTHGLDKFVTVHNAPLIDRGNYEWYDVPRENVGHNVTLVVCDGPPSSTKGGRIGMLPELRSYFGPACTVLLDDLVRPDERRIVNEWCKYPGVIAELRESAKGSGRLQVTASSAMAESPEPKRIGAYSTL